MNEIKICLRCGNKFSRIDNLKRHLKRKNKCPVKFLDVECKDVFENYDELIVAFTQNGINANNILKISKLPFKMAKIKKYQCKDCYKVFKHQSGYSRHCNHHCKGRLVTDPNNYKLNDFGQENTDYLTDTTILNYLKNPENAIELISRYVHFNSLHPENTNVKLLGFSNSFVKIYSQQSWNYYIRDKVIEKMLNSALFIMDDVYSRKKDILFHSQRKKYEKFIKDLEMSRNLKKKIKMQLRLLILNKKIISI